MVCLVIIMGIAGEEIVLVVGVGTVEGNAQSRLAESKTGGLIV